MTPVKERPLGPLNVHEVAAWFIGIALGLIITIMLIVMPTSVYTCPPNQVQVNVGNLYLCTESVASACNGHSYSGNYCQYLPMCAANQVLAMIYNKPVCVENPVISVRVWNFELSQMQTYTVAGMAITAAVSFVAGLYKCLM